MSYGQGDGQVTGGDAARAAFSDLYAELQQMAHRQLGSARHTVLDTVALLNETFLKLDGKVAQVQGRAQFMALAGKAMRQVVANYLRDRQADKRGGGLQRVTLHTGLASGGAADLDALDLETAMQALEQLDPHLAELVECHFYGGMEFAEIAAVRGCSERTVYRDWQRARAWLHTRLERTA
jgi:RNA polymerase sigma factor (TIGR02999 family)